LHSSEANAQSSLGGCLKLRINAAQKDVLSHDFLDNQSRLFFGNGFDSEADDNAPVSSAVTRSVRSAPGLCRRL
jgi:hypothetical protein